MAAKRILIFDLDDTLIDTMTELANLFCDMLQSAQGVADEISRRFMSSWPARGRGPLPAVLEAIGRPDPALVDDITERYWQLAETFEPVALPETLEVLEQLRHSGHTLIVSSGGTTASRRTQDAFDAPRPSVQAVPGHG